MSSIDASTGIRCLIIRQSHVHWSQFSRLLHTSFWLHRRDQLISFLLCQAAVHQQGGVREPWGDAVDSNTLFDKLRPGAVDEVAGRALGRRVGD